MVGTVVTGAVIGMAEATDDDESTTESTTMTTTTQPVPATSAPTAFLPCSPAVLTVEDVKYYRCGTQYYVEAISSGGTVYMPVAPPG